MGRKKIDCGWAKGHLQDARGRNIGFAEGLVGGEARLPTPPLGVEIGGIDG